MQIHASEKVLLTGAGFTHNFGAPLAEGLWASIFNHRDIQGSPGLRALLLENFDFESAYNEVLQGDSFADEDKDAMKRAVELAYRDLDRALIRNAFSSLIFGPNVNRFIHRFTRARKGQGRVFFFTLNQDLYIERKYRTADRLHWPGVNTRPQWYEDLWGRELETRDLCQLPSADELNIDTELGVDAHMDRPRPFYVKLHGSFNWRDSAGGTKMVLGGGKLDEIRREPLLSRYFDLFKRVLYTRGRRLLVIGYGFGDEHINSVLATAAAEHGLKLSIVCPESPRSFSERLSQKPFGSQIWEALSGYFPYSLQQLFPADQTRPPACDALEEHCWGETSWRPGPVLDRP